MSKWDIEHSKGGAREPLIKMVPSSQPMPSKWIPAGSKFVRGVQVGVHDKDGNPVPKEQMHQVLTEHFGVHPKHIDHVDDFGVAQIAVPSHHWHEMKHGSGMMSVDSPTGSGHKITAEMP